MSGHETETVAHGVGWQSRCSCEWVSPSSWGLRVDADLDGILHVRLVNRLARVSKEGN